MKRIKFIPIAALLLLIILLTNACMDKCDGTLCTSSPPSLLLELRDAQNRDLLNPATPNHLDTAQIKQLNGNTVRILPPGLTGIKNSDRAKISLMWASGNSAIYLKLSATDQDTVQTDFETLKGNCCTGFELKSFSYNGKPFTDSVASRYFVVVK